MKTTLISLTLAVALASTTSIASAGCAKGAVIGGIGGHVAGKHGVIGAAAGCLVGRHMEKKKEREAAKQAAAQQAAAQPAPARPAAAPAK